MRVGKPFTLRGSVPGVAGGKVLLQIRPAKAAGWKTLGLASLSKTGAFTFAARLKAAGAYQIRVSFPGDGGHQPSIASTSITAA